MQYGIDMESYKRVGQEKKNKFPVAFALFI